MANNLELLKELTSAFSVDPLGAEDARYVPLHPVGESAIDALQADIELADKTRVLLVAGARGAGKSTEFNRLRKRLEDTGRYNVVVVDALAFLNGSQSLDIHKILITLLATTVDRFKTELSAPTSKTRQKLISILTRLRINIKVAGAEFSASSDGVTAGFAGQAATIDLSGKSQQLQPDLLERMREEVADLRGFVEEVRDFFANLVKDVGKELVVIVDSIDKFRGTRETDAEIQRSIATVFVQYREQLGFPSHHMIYTIPAHINATDPSVAAAYDGAIRFVPVVKLFAQSDPHARLPLSPGVSLLRHVAGKRTTNTGVGVETLLGPDQNGLLDQVIVASGGQLRDMFRLLREVVAIAQRRRVQLPVVEDIVAEAVTTIQRDFSDLYAEDIALAEKVQANNGAPAISETELARLGRLLEAHVLLAQQNGTIWFAVHPLAQRAIAERRRQQASLPSV